MAAGQVNLVVGGAQDRMQQSKDGESLFWVTVESSGGFSPVPVDICRVSHDVVQRC